jgi:hypothetical protein
MSFIYRFITFLTIFALITYLLVGVLEYGLDWYKNSDISVLHEIRSNKNYDLLLMGTSHARMFGVSGHKKDVQAILDKKILSIANNGSGILPQKLYLELFYENHNNADTIIYFIDPWVFYSKDWNESNYYITDEVYRFDYLKKLIANRFSMGVIKEYLHKKLSYKLFIYPIRRKLVFDESISDSDYNALEEFKKERLKLWYPQGTSSKTFRKYSNYLEEIIKLSRKHNSKVIFVLPPTLLGELPGQQEVGMYMKEIANKYGISFYDFSSAVNNRALYLNADHLNIKGVIYFSEKFLVPIL